MEFEYSGTFTYPEDKTVSGSLSGKMVYCGPEESTELNSYPDEHCMEGFKTAFKESMSKKDVVFSEIAKGFCISPRVCEDCVEASHIEEFKNKDNEHSEIEEMEDSSAENCFISAALFLIAVIVAGLA